MNHDTGWAPGVYPSLSSYKKAARRRNVTLPEFLFLCRTLPPGGAPCENHRPDVPRSTGTQNNISLRYELRLWPVIITIL